MMRVLLISCLLGFALADIREWFDDCKGLKFKSNECAYLFDDDGCEGWKLPVSEGYTKLSWFKRNDAEAVAVKPGCILKGKLTCNS